MSTTLRLAGALLLTSALTAPGLAHAQTAPEQTDSSVSQPGDTSASDTPADPGATSADSAPPQDDLEVSIPGGSEIVVTGRRFQNIERSSNQVVSVLSSAEIARTGEGNIAGALAHVPGLSLVGSGFVYVRGLGDRYSLALLNGLPLPSPEPLKRVVPLDLFPTGVIASSLVQKSYSVNYPGEFGGGVINLTTKATPNEPFLKISAGISGDTFTTGNLGYTYYGSKSDWLGYDDGSRNPPPALQEYFDKGLLIGTDNVNSTAIARELVGWRNAVIQQYDHTPVNVSASISAGKTFPLGDLDFGVIAAAGYSNKYLTREIRQQLSQSADLSSLEKDFRQVSTDQRTTINGLLGFGLEGDGNKLRWTTLYIHDTLKKASLAFGQRPAQNGDTDFIDQRTAFYERQLLDTQAVAELELAPELHLDARMSYANSKRKAPGELTFEYVRTNSEADPFGQYFVNRLNNGNGGDGGITFSDLNEDLYAAGLDLSYRATPSLSLTGGLAYSDTRRTSSRRDFLFLAPNQWLGSPYTVTAIGMLRPDLLLSPNVVDALGITMIETDPGTPKFGAGLTTKAGYLKGNWQVTDSIAIDAGVRYEDGSQFTKPIPVFVSVPPSVPEATLQRSYWLPAATLTFDLQNSMQIRLNASKTIARPQFRELIAQPYYDPESNRPYRGNPLLVDSELFNAEARFEWYFAPEQRVSLAGFYKHIDKPIEAFVSGVDLLTSYANAPKADLYGGELEVAKYWPLQNMGGDFFDGRRVVTILNYTYTKSQLKVGADDTVAVYGAASTIATDYFRDGAPLTGQSDHIVNLQLGLEDTDRLSQQTFLLSYASDRVVSRGLNGSPPQPDVIERPGIKLDFVWREGFTLFGAGMEAKFEARNIFGQGHQEFQEAGDNRIDINTYDVGTTLAFTLGIDL